MQPGSLDLLMAFVQGGTTTILRAFGVIRVFAETLRRETLPWQRVSPREMTFGPHRTSSLCNLPVTGQRWRRTTETPDRSP